ncbi:MAG TPA: class I SAM-dependent methyltransferase [bacterium]|nr:class I SAM-dependent methyltransferase [bacterium]
MSILEQPALDENKLHDFLVKVVSDLGAAANAALVVTGDRLGLYRALAQHGPLTSEELARRTETAERYVREWLATQAASGYVQYSPADRTFWMTPEQQMALANEDSPVLMTGGFYSVASVVADEPVTTEAFRTGEGVAWGDHHECLFCGTEKFFRPSYKGNLIGGWIPALDGVHEKLERGAHVADVGCGRGASTLILAERYPSSTFVGFDPHGPSILEANLQAKEAGLTNVRFEKATAQDFPGRDYDLVCCFDCLHDMGDPVGAASHIRQALAQDGTWMIVEPYAGDSLEENLNPVGRIYYAFSTTVCTPTSLSQDVGLALGAQAGEAKLSRVVTDGGFSRVRRAAETPFNLVLEARP